MPKSPKISKREAIIARKFRRNLFLIPLSAFVIKLFIILNIQGFDWYSASKGDLASGLRLLLDNRYAPPNAWYGADGENYIQALTGLADQGFLSDVGNLSYWPAGYPLLMWPLLEIFGGLFFAAVAFFQSALYFLGSAWLVDEISRTRFSRASFPLAVLLSFNPTLALNTISIGYELPVVSLSLISLAAFVRHVGKRKSSIFTPEVIIASISFLLATFMQPRLIVIGFSFFLVWALSIYGIRMIAPLLALTMGIVAIAPLIMVYRNQLVHGYSAISTNLGVTMRLGAGPSASGGYSSTPSGLVECPAVEGDAAKRDAETVKCVIEWYFDNPTTALKLFWNKARYFWSPWFGPEANGTMARNPWSQNHPLKATAQTEDGFNLIFGSFGKIISWLWMLFGFVIVVVGFGFLWRLGGLERAIALIAGSSLFINLVSSMLTIGDHRFRIPSMGMSLLLQAAGLLAIFRRKDAVSSSQETLVNWPSLRGISLLRRQAKS